MTSQAILLLGSNMGDSALLLEQCRSLIASKIGTIERASNVYQSEPWQMNDAQWFLNQAVRVKTELSAAELLSVALEIERTMGRERIHNSESGYQSRTMDIDILFFNGEVHNSRELIIPHPRLHERRFALATLMDLGPGFVHPTLELSIEALWEQCEDASEVRPHSKVA